MDNNHPLLAGYKVCEYQLVLNPHEALRQKITETKQAIAQEVQHHGALYSKPYLALASFTQLEMMEEKIVHRLRLTTMGLAPIKVVLSDYGSFPAHTIFINVTSKLPIQHLVKTIRQDAQRLMKYSDEHKPYFLLDPHLTIARKLQPWQYETAWNLYQHKHFTGKFIADAVLLLKRAVGTKAYQIAQRFPLAYLPVNTRQGALF